MKRQYMKPAICLAGVEADNLLRSISAVRVDKGYTESDIESVTITSGGALATDGSVSFSKDYNIWEEDEEEEEE